MEKSPYIEKPPPYSEGDEGKSFYPPPTYSQHPGYGAIHVEPVAVPVTQVVMVGGCPACRVGVLDDSYSLLGILCSILFFPLGILCCLAMREKRCTNCGATF